MDLQQHYLIFLLILVMSMKTPIIFVERPFSGASLLTPTHIRAAPPTTESGVQRTEIVFFIITKIEGKNSGNLTLQERK